jgi:hypothetical protein
MVGVESGVVDAEGSLPAQAARETMKIAESRLARGLAGRHPADMVT